jgi:hypothetical protein
MICAMSLENLTHEKVIGLIDKALSKYAEQNELKDMQDMLLVVSVSKSTEGKIGEAEPQRKAAASPRHGIT